MCVDELNPCESGSGKSTLAELIIGLQRPTVGSIAWEVP
ncbi:ATP-binding cassette domain-containing protein [Cohnella abietis]